MVSRGLIAALLAIILIAALTTFALAQTEAPSPYKGLKNPSPWTDAQAQAAGKNVYQQNCVGCHGTAGSGLPAFDFSSADFSKKMETGPDFYFWVVSEGRLAKGMPGYKSSLSDEQRWQALTYVWSLSTAHSAGSSAAGPSVSVATMTLAAPPQANTGENLTFTASLKDAQGKPVGGAAIKFYLKEDFFAQSLMELGETTTDAQGNANFKYMPRGAGDTVVVAKFETFQREALVIIQDSGKSFYHVEAGLKLPSGGPEVFIGPESAHVIDDNGDAPQIALRLPGGLFSWLWLFIGVLALIWGTYFLTMFQVLRISAVTESRIGNNRTSHNRLIPLIAMAVVLGLGLLMIFMIITGPYSHFHLTP